MCDRIAAKFTDYMNQVKIHFLSAYLSVCLKQKIFLIGIVSCEWKIVSHVALVFKS